MFIVEQIKANVRSGIVSGLGRGEEETSNRKGLHARYAMRGISSSAGAFLAVKPALHTTEGNFHASSVSMRMRMGLRLTDDRAAIMI
jgi:hypothetical protein